MNQIDQILKSYTILPTDVCNIILQYSVIHIEQICYNTYIQYKYNDKRHSAEYSTLGAIDNSVFIFRLRACDHKRLYIMNIDQNRLFDKHTPMSNEIYIMKYSNGLVCQHFNYISIYSVTISDTVVFNERCKRMTNNTLLYANDQYIITRYRYDDGMHIYDTNLIEFAFIKTDDYVRYVALVDDVLSYYTHDWHVLVF